MPGIVDHRQFFLLFFCPLLIGVPVLPLAGEPAEVIIVQGTRVNIRTGPGLQFPVQEEVRRGKRLIALQQEGDWYKVEMGLGRYGWINKALVRTNPLRRPLRLPRNMPEAPPDFSGPRLVLDQYIRFFQNYISPADGARSTLYPTTSAYSREAIQKHGPLIGLLMTLDRLMHDRDEVHRAPRIRKFGEVWPYDPVERNDFWWTE